MYFSFAGQDIADTVRRSDAANIGAEEQYDFLKHILVSLIVTLFVLNSISIIILFSL